MMPNRCPTGSPRQSPRVRGARRAAALLATALLAACQTPTPYVPAPARGFGYSDQQIETGRFRVLFRGNQSTMRAAVEDFVLYRAAEITLANGYDFFVVVDGETEAISSFTGNGTTFGGPGFGSGGFGFNGFFYGSGFAQTTTTFQERRRYEAGAVIQTYKGKKPDIATAYDARSVISSLEQRIAASLDPR